MSRSNHVVSSKLKGGWAVRKYGSSRASKNFETKADAINYAKQISKSERTELYIHKKDGTIQNRNSYGNDPHSTRG